MMDYDFDYREHWLDEARQEAALQNPLIGYCERVVITRTKCIRRSGKKKGSRRKYKNHEVELLRFLPSRRCVLVKDLDTPGLDALAEEVFRNYYVPPDTNPAQLFLEYFRKL